MRAARPTWRRSGSDACGSVEAAVLAAARGGPARGGPMRSMHGAVRSARGSRQGHGCRAPRRAARRCMNSGPVQRGAHRARGDPSFAGGVGPHPGRAAVRAVWPRVGVWAAGKARVPGPVGAGCRQRGCVAEQAFRRVLPRLLGYWKWARVPPNRWCAGGSGRVVGVAREFRSQARRPQPSDLRLVWAGTPAVRADGVAAPVWCTPRCAMVADGYCSWRRPHPCGFRRSVSAGMIH